MSSITTPFPINWITRKTTANKRNGIQRTLLTPLDDLSYADDLALLLHNLWQLQEKTSHLDDNSACTAGVAHPQTRD